MAPTGVRFHAPPANHSQENSGDICDTEDWEKILDILKYFSLNICLGWRTLLFVRAERETQCKQTEMSDPGRMTANQRPFLGQLTNERPGKNSKFVTALFTVFVICEQGIYHLMPRIPAIVITVTHSLFGCDHWVTTGWPQILLSQFSRNWDVSIVSVMLLKSATMTRQRAASRLDWILKTT